MRAASSMTCTAPTRPGRRAAPPVPGVRSTAAAVRRARAAERGRARRAALPGARPGAGKGRRPADRSRHRRTASPPEPRRPSGAGWTGSSPSPSLSPSAGPRMTSRRGPGLSTPPPRPSAGGWTGLSPRPRTRGAERSPRRGPRPGRGREAGEGARDRPRGFVVGSAQVGRGLRPAGPRGAGEAGRPRIGEDPGRRPRGRH